MVEPASAVMSPPARILILPPVALPGLPPPCVAETSAPPTRVTSPPGVTKMSPPEQGLPLAVIAPVASIVTPAMAPTRIVPALPPVQLPAA